MYIQGMLPCFDDTKRLSSGDKIGLNGMSTELSLAHFEVPEFGNSRLELLDVRLNETVLECSQPYLSNMLFPTQLCSSAMETQDWLAATPCQLSSVSCKVQQLSKDSARVENQLTKPPAANIWSGCLQNLTNVNHVGLEPRYTDMCRCLSPASNVMNKAVHEEPASPVLLPCVTPQHISACSPPLKLSHLPASRDLMMRDTTGHRQGNLLPKLPPQTLDFASQIEIEQLSHQHCGQNVAADYQKSAKNSESGLTRTAVSKVNLRPGTHGRGTPPGAPKLPSLPASCEVLQHEMDGMPSKCWESGSTENLTLEFLEVGGYFDLPLHQAAAKLQVGITTLKKACRRHGMDRWPYRKRSSLEKLISKTQEHLAADPLQCQEAIAELEAERKKLRGNPRCDIPKQVKRFRQSIFKREFKNRKQEVGGGCREGLLKHCGSTLQPLPAI